MTAVEFEEWVRWYECDISDDNRHTSDKWWSLPKEIRNKVTEIVYGPDAWEESV